jgi:hypothetical protein
MKNMDQAGSQYVLQQEDPRLLPLSDEIIEETPSEERTCLICGEGRSNLRLDCSHCFHSRCLQQDRRCPDCLSEDILPARAYCGICERRYAYIEHIESRNVYICRTCEET